MSVGALELFSPSELVEELRRTTVTIHQRWNGQAKAVGGASTWTAVELGGQLAVVPGHLQTVLALRHERAGQHLIVGGDFNASFFGLTDFHNVAESIPTPNT